jgi:glucose-6-phosphate 1-epimerase
MHDGIAGPWQKYEIAGRIQIVPGNGGLPKIRVATPSSTAEIYLHGAHVTHFQKTGEPPLLFLSRRSRFQSGEPIRGGVPICFPWFGNRHGEPSHGFARLTSWRLVDTAADEQSATIQLALPPVPGRETWNGLRTEFIVTVADTLTMELITTNQSGGETVSLENCLHTYFQVGDIAAVSIAGLEDRPFDNFAAGANGTHRPAENSLLKIRRETNRVYGDAPQTVEIRDEKFRRTIRVEKSGSRSTVVWNPWTTQKLPDDFDPAEHARMVCVESGNVKQNAISLAPGRTTALKVVLSSRPG